MNISQKTKSRRMRESNEDKKNLKNLNEEKIMMKN